VLPDTFIDHGKPEQMYEQAGLNASGIVATVLGAIGIDQQRARRVGEFGLH
jgi:1-deoxy-D-xylulose-5-phosphate synthase